MEWDHITAANKSCLTKNLVKWHAYFDSAMTLKDHKNTTIQVEQLTCMSMNFLEYMTSYL